MISARTKNPGFQIGALLRGEAETIAGWISGWTAKQTFQQVLAIIIGAGAFGAAIGSWRSPEQALASAIKLPFVLLATATGNALINGMLAPLLGLTLRLRESFAAVLTSFSLVAVILGAFSPLMVFLVWNVPPPVIGTANSAAAHNVMLLTLVGLIAFAGITANLRLLQLLRRLGAEPAAAWRLLLAWLTVNLLLGSQVSWVARPFIGQADIPFCFLEQHAFHGSFFEAVAQAATQLWSHLVQ